MSRNHRPLVRPLSPLCLAGPLLWAGSHAAAVDHLVPVDFGDIQSAITAASDGDRIVISPGVYTGVGNINLDTGGKAVEIVGGGAVTIDCAGAGRAFLFDDGEGPDTIVDGVRIINGFAAGGGAIRCNASSPTIRSCVFESNSAGSGGAVDAVLSAASFEECHFLDNQATAVGGAVYVLSGQPSFHSCMFQVNFAPRGGAIHLLSSAAAIIDNCDFIQNDAAAEGGALSIDNLSPPVIRNCRFSGNFSDNIGGAVWINRTSTPTFENVQFEGNEALVAGGAVYNLESQPRFVDSTFFANSASDFGGGIVNTGATADLSLYNCSLTDNHTLSVASGFGGAVHNDTGRFSAFDTAFTANFAEQAGGAIYNSNEYSPVLLVRCTVYANKARAGGGICITQASNLTMANCRVIGNHATHESGGGIWLSHTFRTRLHNVEFSGNVAQRNGGAIALHFGDTALYHTTLSRNHANNQGGGLYHAHDAYVANSILWRNLDSSGPTEAAQITIAAGTTTVDYSNVQAWTGIIPGVGVISAPPQFVDAFGPDGAAGTLDDDLHLQATSPSVDAASPFVLPLDEADVDGDGDVLELLPSDIDLDPRRMDVGSVVDTGPGPAPVPDMGADEVTTPCAADLTGDGAVDVFDLLDLLGSWGACPAPCPPCPADLTGDCVVDVFDLLDLLGGWGPC